MYTSHFTLRREWWFCLVILILFSPLVETKGTAQEQDALSRGIKAYEEGSYEQAISLLREAVQNEASPRGYFYLGHAYYFQESYDKARDMYKKAGEHGLSKDQQRMFLARVDIGEGHPDQALERLRPMLKQSEPESFVYRMFGRALEELEQYNRAAEIYHQALIQHGPDDSLLQTLYFLYLKQNRYGEARQYARRLIQRNPLTAHYHKLEANAALQQGQTSEAETALEHARLLGADDLDLIQSLADLKARNKHYYDAIAYYRQYIDRTDTASGEDLYRLGLSYLETNQFESARQRLTEAAQKNTSYLNGVLRFIRTLYQKRGFEDARTQLERMIEQFPNQAELYKLQGNLFMKEDRPTQAFSSYQRIGFDDLTDTDVLYNYILAAMRSGEKDRALELLKQSIARYPDHKDFRKLLNRALENNTG